MNSFRYGCTRTIAARTGHRCHLCYGAIDIALYGRTGVFAGEVRAKLAGRTSRPWSAVEQVAATVAVGGLAIGAGHVFREPETNKFSWAAAGIAGGAAVLLIVLAS